jgi:hypothetical protein
MEMKNKGGALWTWAKWNANVVKYEMGVQML